MRKLAIFVVATTLLALVGCIKPATMWDTCDSTNPDNNGTDGTYVLICRDGSWEPLMTNAEYARWAKGERFQIAPLPTRPTTTTTTTTTTSTTSTTTTTIDPTLGTGSLIYNGPAGQSVSGTLSNGASVYAAQGTLESQTSMSLARYGPPCGFMHMNIYTLTGVSGTATQGSTSVHFDLTTTTNNSTTNANWRILDINNGPITFTFDSVTTSATPTCY